MRWRGRIRIGARESPTAAPACTDAAARRRARGRSDLHDLSQIHHRDAAADVLDEPQIVRDEQIRQLQLLLQIHQQVDDLRLHRHVERRDRLVEHQERRIERQRARQADALPLSAAELVRVSLEMRGIEADQAETAPRRARAAPCDRRAGG